MDSFIFFVVCRGLGGWHQRAFFVHSIRTLLEKYPQFNATLFDYDATIFDLITTVKVKKFIETKQVSRRSWRRRC